MSSTTTEVLGVRVPRGTKRRLDRVAKRGRRDLPELLRLTVDQLLEERFLTRIKEADEKLAARVGRPLTDAERSKNTHKVLRTLSKPLPK